MNWWLRKIAWNLPLYIVARWLAGDGDSATFLWCYVAILVANTFGYAEATFEPMGYLKWWRGEPS